MTDSQKIVAGVIASLVSLGVILDLIHWKEQSILADRFLEWWMKLHQLNLSQAVFQSAQAADRFVDRWSSPKIFSKTSFLLAFSVSLFTLFCVCAYHNASAFLDLMVVGPWWLSLPTAIVFLLPGVVAFFLTRLFVKAIALTSNILQAGLILLLNYIVARFIAAVILGIFWSVAFVPIWWSIQHPGQKTFTIDQLAHIGALIALVTGAMAATIFIPSACATLAIHCTFVMGYVILYIAASLLYYVELILDGVLMTFNNKIFTVIAGALSAAGTMILTIITYEPVTWLWHQLDSLLDRLDGIVGGAFLMGLSYLLAKCIG